MLIIMKNKMANMAKIFDVFLINAKIKDPLHEDNYSLIH